MTRPRRNDVSDQQIVDMYQQIGRGTVVAKRLGISIPTVYATLRKHGIPLEWPRGRERASDQQIALAYEDLGTGTAAAREVGVSIPTAYAALHRLGSLHRESKPKQGPADEEIAAAYQQIGRGTLVAKQFNIPPAAVYAALQRQSIPLVWPRGKSRTIDAEIIAAYQARGSGIAIAKTLHVSESVVYDVLARHGIDTGGYWKQLRGVKGDDEQRVLDLYRQGLSAPKIGATLGIKPSMIRSHLHRAKAVVSKSLSPEQKLQAVELYTSGLTSGQTAEKIGVPEWKVLRYIQRDHPALIRKLGKRERASGWKGGRWLHKGSGYMYVHVAEDDPLAAMRNREGYVLEHRLVMARKLNRPLISTETVHHKDLDRTNNAEDNLQLRHGKHGKNAVMRCADCGSHNIVAADIAD